MKLHDLSLIFRLFLMGLRDRILGSSLGFIWIILNPILMLSIFTYVFGFVFKSKVPGSEKSIDFVIWLISGYGPWLAISESLSSGTASVTSNSSIVKNVSFKTEILPMAYSLMGFIPLLISTIYVGVLFIFKGQNPLVGILFSLPIVVCQQVLIIGIVLFLSSLNVFVRDVSLILPNILLMLLFATPIFYSLESFPLALQKVSIYNPFYLICEGYRKAILHNSFLSIKQFIYLSGVSISLFLMGLRFFRKLKSYFDSRL